MRKQFAAWLVLGIITIIAGICLAATNELTKGPIEEQALLAADQARRQVLPQAEVFVMLSMPEDAAVDWCYYGMNSEAIIVGWTAQITVNGFGGPVEVIVGADATGTVTGVSVGGSAFAETAGLGAKAKEDEFTGQFVNKVTPLRVVKGSQPRGDDTIDAITSATITSKAVTDGVNAVVEYMLEFAQTPMPLGGAE